MGGEVGEEQVGGGRRGEREREGDFLHRILADEVKVKCSSIRGVYSHHGHSMTPSLPLPPSLPAPADTSRKAYARWRFSRHAFYRVEIKRLSNHAEVFKHGNEVA